MRLLQKPRAALRLATVVVAVRHFDEAMRTARKSVSKSELARYLKYKEALA